MNRRTFISSAFTSSAVLAASIVFIKPLPKKTFTGVNVRKFGAVGDGVTDDTLAIQRAINCGRPFYFPRGRYLVTNGASVVQE